MDSPNLEFLIKQEIPHMDCIINFEQHYVERMSDLPPQSPLSFEYNAMNNLINLEAPPNFENSCGFPSSGGGLMNWSNLGKMSTVHNDYFDAGDLKFFCDFLDSDVKMDSNVPFEAPVAISTNATITTTIFSTVNAACATAAATNAAVNTTIAPVNAAANTAFGTTANATFAAVNSTVVATAAVVNPAVNFSVSATAAAVNPPVNTTFAASAVAGVKPAVNTTLAASAVAGVKPAVNFTFAASAAVVKSAVNTSFAATDAGVNSTTKTTFATTVSATSASNPKVQETASSGGMVRSVQTRPRLVLSKTGMASRVPSTLPRSIFLDRAPSQPKTPVPVPAAPSIIHEVPPSPMVDTVMVNREIVPVIKVEPPKAIMRRVPMRRYRKSALLQLTDIQKYFGMPIIKAAKEMKVGLTVLKKRCRELNITRWPHRKIKSLRTLINNVKEMGLELKEIEMLEEHRKLVERLPHLELTERAKKLRQACFKDNYKRRKSMSMV